MDGSVSGGAQGLGGNNEVWCVMLYYIICVRHHGRDTVGLMIDKVGVGGVAGVE